MISLRSSSERGSRQKNITMTQEWYEQPFVFPKWANYLLPAIVLGVVGGLFYVPTVVGLGASPKTTAVGYAPVQPVPYSHALARGEAGY